MIDDVKSCSAISITLNLNDISNICKSIELILFADDTNIFGKGKSKQEVYIEANVILKHFSIYIPC